MSDSREAATRSIGELTRHIVERHENERAVDGQVPAAPASLIVTHDPLDRQLEGEPHFALLARDPLAPPFVRLYAAVVAGEYHRAPDLLQMILRTAKTRPQRPHKDVAHKWSAVHVAQKMELWAIQHLKGAPPQNRINTGPDRDTEVFKPGPTIAEIKNARPPIEPEDAQ